MRRTALIACALLLSTASCSAATADELWQDYQNKPAVVSTTPIKPAERTTPDVTIEPTERTKPDVTVKPTEPTTPNVTVEPTAEAKAPESAAPTTAATPNVGTKPVSDATKPKPKPKLQLVGKPPLPKQFMRTPQTSDFTSVTSVAGGYSISLPTAFGTDPLAELPQTEGAMLVRTKDDTLMCAVTVLDATDAASFNAMQPLPAYENASLHWSWQQEAALLWNVKLSSHSDYHGDKMLLEAKAEQAGKTYQMLFVLPSGRYTELLPQAVYALNSFRLN